MYYLYTEKCCKGSSKKYTKWHFQGSCPRETPKLIYIKFGIGDYAKDATQYSKWHVNQFRG